MLTKPVYYRRIELLHRLCFVDDKKLFEIREGIAQDPGLLTRRQFGCFCVPGKQREKIYVFYWKHIGL